MTDATRYRAPLIAPLGPTTPGDWRNEAACSGANPERWFPNKGGSEAIARRICALCPVAANCLDDALAAGPGLHGIWGGLNQKQRRNILRHRNARRYSADTINAALERYEELRPTHRTAMDTYQAVGDALGIPPRNIRNWVTKANHFTEGASST